MIATSLLLSLLPKYIWCALNFWGTLNIVSRLWLRNAVWSGHVIFECIGLTVIESTNWQNSCLEIFAPCRFKKRRRPMCTSGTAAEIAQQGHKVQSRNKQPQLPLSCSLRLRRLRALKDILRWKLNIFRRNKHGQAFLLTSDRDNDHAMATMCRFPKGPFINFFKHQVRSLNSFSSIIELLNFVQMTASVP